MSWSDVIESHPLMEESASTRFWERYLQENPDVLFRMLGDLYQVASQSRETPDSLEDLWAVVTPTFSHDPFGDAVRAKLDGQSIRALAQRCGYAHQELSRWLNGKYPVVMLHDVEGSMRRLERIARALRVHPSYFAEWRRLWAMSLLDVAFESQPNLSVSFFRKFSRLEHAGNGR